MPCGDASLGLIGLNAIHIFVRTLSRTRAHYLDVMDFAEIAVSGPTFEAMNHARASIVQAGGVRIALIEPLGPESEAYEWLEYHPEGVARLAFDVADLERAHGLLQSRGATLITELIKPGLGCAELVSFDIATALGDVAFRFVQHSEDSIILPGLEILEVRRGGANRFGITNVDHITSNLLTLQPTLAWMSQVMGFQRHWDIQFHTCDVGADGHGSGIKSTVMWDPVSTIKFANNEPLHPFFRSSQVYRFCRSHRGPGIQHIAFAVSDLVEAVKGLRQRGAQFVPTSAAYYEALPHRLKSTGVIQIQEDIEDLRKLNILVDGQKEHQYLLQIFMKEAAAIHQDPHAGPFFIELLERKGDDGFGTGNFRALFESIERQQCLEAAAL